MQVIVSESSMFERTLEVIVGHEQVEGAYQRAFGKAAKRLRLPGFRPGKVPVSMARRYITDEGLGSDVIDEVVPRAYVEALRQQNLQPISQPKWELVQRERGKDLIFKVSFEVKPVVELTGYTGVELKNEKDEVSDDTVNAALDEIRLRHSRVVDVAEPRPLQLDDLALVDYRSTLEGESVEGGAATNYLMEVKPEHFIPGFVDQLVGLSPGDEKEFDITFPEDYPNQVLAGKSVHFHFKLHQIKVRELPAADDEFARSISPHATLEELRADIRERQEGNAERKAREQVAIKIIDRLLAQVTNEMVPRSLHQYRSQVEMRRRVGQLDQAGLTLERYLADRKITEQQWMMELSVMGMLEARVEIVLNSIATKEGLLPTEEEIEELLAVEAKNQGVSLSALKAHIEKEGNESLIRYALLRAKVMDFLFDNAKVEFVPPGTLIEEAPAEAPEADQAEKPEAKEEKKSKSKPKAKKAEEEVEAAAEPAEAKPAKKSRAAKEETKDEAAEPVEEKPKAKRAPKKKAEAEA